MPKPPSESGFVLVGVIMFVLALTILGLSLFSLSGYEAQFLGDSMNQSQAFYDAMSGMDRVKFGLAATGKLSEAGDHLPPGVVAARAIQYGDSTANVVWSDQTSAGYITIRVLAQHGTVSKALEASFSPNQVRTLYHELLATTGRAAVDTLDVNSYKHTCAWVGTVRQNDADALVWFGFHGDSIPGNHPFLGGGVPAPEVTDFINTYDQPGISTVPHPSANRFDLSVLPPDEFKFFKGPVGMGGDGYGLDEDSGPGVKIDVGAGTAIWLLRDGAYFEDDVTVTGLPWLGRLIIVAGSTSDATFKPETHAKTGLWFNGGLSSQVPVILVSSGTVAISQVAHAAADAKMNLPYLSIFAGGIFLRGPNGTDPNRGMNLYHPSDQDAVLDPMYDKGLLPNTIGGHSKAFVLVPGSWQDVTAAFSH